MRSGLYPAAVWAFDPTTGIARVSIRQLFGDQVVSVQPEVARQSDIPRIIPVTNGDVVLVFFEGGDDTRLKWMPRVIDDWMISFFDGRYVNVTGDTMTGPLQINSTLGVTGASTLASATLSGALQVNSTFGVTGTSTMAAINAGAIGASVVTTGRVDTTAAEALRLLGANSYIDWWDGANRIGYLQGNPTQIYLNADGPGPVSLRLRGGGGLYLDNGVGNYQLTSSVVGTRAVATDANGYIFSNYFNMTANVASGNPQYIAGQVSSDNYLRWFNSIPGSWVNGNVSAGQIVGTVDAATQIGWGTVQVRGQSHTGAGNSAGGFTAWVGNSAPEMLCYESVGEAWLFRNSADSGYINVFANSYQPSSSSIKENIREEDTLLLLEKVEQLGPVMRYDLMTRPKSVRPTERFTAVNERWVDSGHTELTLTAKHTECLDHDCALDPCSGTSVVDDPCNIILSDTEQLGHLAEDVHQIFPEWTYLDGDNNPMGMNVGQQVAVALACIGYLSAANRDLQARVTKLEARPGGPKV